MKQTKRETRMAHAMFKPLRTVTQYPAGHLLNPATRYVPAALTDVAKTIARERTRLAALAKETAGMQPGLFDNAGAA